MDERKNCYRDREMFEQKYSDQKCVNGQPKGQCPLYYSRVVLVDSVGDNDFDRNIYQLNYYVSGKFQFTGPSRSVYLVFLSILTH